MATIHQQLTRSIALFAVSLGATVLLLLFPSPYPSSSKPDPMARSFILWLHGLGDSGPANEPIKNFFTSPEFKRSSWSFPSAPLNPVTCNHGAVMPSWFDIHEIPVTADSPKDESAVLKAVKNVHAMIDKVVDAGTNPNNVFVCGFSQGGALTLASVLLYPKTLWEEVQYLVGGSLSIQPLLNEFIQMQKGHPFYGLMEWTTER